MPIAFSLVPSNLRTPGVYVEFDNSKAVQGLVNQEHRILIMGQRLASGTKPAAEVVEMFSADDAKLAFGEGSSLHHMVGRAKAVNGTNRIFGIALDDNPAGAAAVGSIAWTGPATAAGTIHLYIAGRKITVGVPTGATPGAIATSVAAAATAAPALALLAAVNATDTAKVDFTSRHAGEIGNDLDLRLNYNPGEVLPAGVAATIVQPTGGTGNPDILDAIAALGDEQYTELVTPWVDGANLTALETELADRWGPVRPIDGQAYLAMDDTVGSLATFGDGRNSPHVTAAGIKSSPTPAYEIASVLAAIVSAQAQIDPARPLTALPLPGVLAPAVADRFTQSERNALLGDGISTLVVDAGGSVVIERLISMWQVNAAGSPDESYYDLNTILTLSYLRFSLRARLASRFSRSKLAKDGTRFGAGQPVVTPKIAKAEVVALFDEWEAAGLVEDVDQFVNDLQVEIADDPVRLNILVPPNLVNPLLITACKLEFRR